MNIEHLIAFNIALLAAIASPGPALLVAIQTTLNAGRKTGVAIGFGLALMAATWTMVALLGLEAIFHLFPWLYGLSKFIGAMYLLYIAWGMWRGAREKVNMQTKPISHAFRQGFLINLLNPKSVLFAAAVLIAIFPANMTVFECSFVVLNHLIVEIAFYTALAFVMSTKAVSDKYFKAKIYLDRIAGLILGGLGMSLLISR